MSKYEDFMKQITWGKGCDDCPLYHNGFCDEEIGEENEEGITCGEVLNRYLNRD